MVLQSQLGISESTLVGSTMVAGTSGDDPLEPVIEQVLGISDAIGPPIQSVSDALSLVQQVSIILLIDDFESIIQVLGLTDEAVPGLFQDINQSLGITDIAVALVFGPIEQDIGVSHFASFVGPQAVSVADVIAISDVAVPKFDIIEIVNQSLGITDLAVSVQKDELGLTQLAMGYVNTSPDFENDLNLSQTVQNNLAFNGVVADTNAVVDSVTYFIDDGGKCFKNEFNQFGTLPALPFLVPSGAGAKLLFSSITGTAEVVVLRNPEPDDRDRLGQTRINRESRGGELQVFRDPVWPEVNTIQGTIIGLKIEKMEELLEFFEDHLGEEISMNDWKGRYWRGVIVNPGEAVVEDTNDRWTVAFEFEGIEIDGPDVFDPMGIIDLMVHNVDYTRDLTDDLGVGQTVDPGLQNVHFGSSTPNNVQNSGDEVFYSG